MNETLDSFRAPVTTSLSEQRPLPNGLPRGWPELTLGAQTIYLNSHAPLLRVNTYLSAGLETGARRLDQVREKAGKAAVHETALLENLGTDTVYAAFESGNTDQVETAKMMVPLDQRGDYAHLVATAKSIEQQFGSVLLNPALLYGMFGYNSATKKHIGPSRRTFELGVFHAINAAKWDLSLRGLAGVIHMHQSAARLARNLVRPLLDEAIASPVIEGMEHTFWHTRLAGAPKSFGIAYYLGYRAKSAPVLKGEMQAKWDADYWRNREILTTALNINTKQLPKSQRASVQSRVRLPVFKLIGEGDFNAAFTLLHDTAEVKPELFSIASRQFLAKVAK